MQRRVYWCDTRYVLDMFFLFKKTKNVFGKVELKITLKTIFFKLITS